MHAAVSEFDLPSVQDYNGNKELKCGLLTYACMIMEHNALVTLAWQITVTFSATQGENLCFVVCCSNSKFAR